ncbi:hypothetical protein H8958_014025, partial [Nasalis larvatus]
MIPAPRRSQPPARRRRGWDSKALPIPCHFHVARIGAFRVALCLDGRPHSAQRGRIQSSVSAWDSGSRGKVRLRRSRLGQQIPAAPDPSLRRAPWLSNQGAARERATANQERRERRREPAGAERARESGAGGGAAAGRELGESRAAVWVSCGQRRRLCRGDLPADAGDPADRGAGKQLTRQKSTSHGWSRVKWLQVQTLEPDCLGLNCAVSAITTLS